MKKSLLLTGIAFALGAGTALAQVKPEVMVKQRQAAMTLQAKYLGQMVPMAQGKVPFRADVVAYDASLLDALSRMAWDGFAESTKDVRDVKTAALPVIWSEPAKFKQAQDNFHNAVDALVRASKGGDEAAMKAAIGGVGKTCGGCHENFRQK